MFWDMAVRGMETRLRFGEGILLRLKVLSGNGPEEIKEGRGGWCGGKRDADKEAYHYLQPKYKFGKLASMCLFGVIC